MPGGASGEVGRAAERFAIAATGGALASGWGLTGWPTGAALAAAERCFCDWLQARGTAGGSDVDGGVRAVRLFIEQHGGSRFQSLNDATPDQLEQAVVNRAGFKRMRGGRCEFLFQPETFRQDVLRGFNAEAVAAELRERGLLVHETDRLQLKPRILGKPQWVYAVRDAILETDRHGDAVEEEGA